MGWFVTVPGVATLDLQGLDVAVGSVTGAGYGHAPGVTLPATAAQRTLVLRCTSKQRRGHLQAKRAEIGALLTPGRAVVLSYSGALRQLDLRARFTPQADDLEPARDELVLRFVADDPLWSLPLDNDSVVAELEIASGVAAGTALERSAAGVWQALGGGPGGAVLTCAYSPAGLLYVGGAFGVKYWSGSSWIAVGAVGGTCEVLRFAPDGLLYAGGSFGLKYWQAGSWSATGIAATVYALAFVLTATTVRLYVGGSFGLRRWSHTGLALDGGFTLSCNGTVYGLAAGLDGAVYAGGTFTTLGAVAALRVASIVDAMPAALGAGFAATVYGLATLPDGRVAVGGDAGVQLWNGQAWTDLAYPDGAARAVAATSDGELVVAGATAYNLGFWTGASWPLADHQVPGGGLRAVAVAGDGRVAVGCAMATSGSALALTTVVAEGTAAAPVRLLVTGPGVLQRAVNLTGSRGPGAEQLAATGRVALYLDFALLAGETLMIDLGARTVTSSLRSGQQLQAIAPGSTFWQLQPGQNVIGLFLTATSGATAAQLQYWPRWWSVESADG